MIPICEIKFEDEDLKNFIVEHTKDADGKITLSEALKVTKLKNLALNSKYALKIDSLEGLQFFENLVELFLGGQNIVSISVLGSLKNLEALFLFSNKIEDISALSGLANLKNLDISDNDISDISILGDLTTLEVVHITKNKISDLNMVITTLKKLSNLGTLDIRFNPFQQDIESKCPPGGSLSGQEISAYLQCLEKQVST